MRISDWSSDVCSSDLTLVWNEASPDGHEAIKLGKGTEPPVTLLDIGPTRGDGELRFGRIETIPYTTAHGFSLEGKLLYPTDYVEGNRYPLLVDAYPINSGTGWMPPKRGTQAGAHPRTLVFSTTHTRPPTYHTHIT